MAKKFEIANRNSGLVLGVYEGDTKEQALDAMARDAGYSSYAAIPEEVGSEDDLIVAEVE
jgi:hypothetical protein